MTEFNHRVYQKAYQISFWKNGVACDRSELERTSRVEVGSWHYEFKMPEEHSAMVNFCYMLNAAFALGRNDKQEEILKVLGVR